MAPFNAWPVLFLTFPVVVWLIDGAGAGRLRGVPAAALTGWWFGLGYFVPGSTGSAMRSWSTRRLSPGCCRLPCSAFPPASPFHGVRLRACPPDLDPRRVAGPRARDRPHGQRMAAWPCAVRLSLECVRLRAVRAAGAGADRVADRPLGSDLPDRRDLRQPRRADRRRFARAQAVDRAGGGAVALVAMGVFGAFRLSQQPTRRCQMSSCASCSPTCSRTSNSTTPPRRR